MILSIDNKKPNEEELETIKETQCLKCKGKFYPRSSRVIFVNTGKNVLWWHGLDKSKKGAEYLCKRVVIPKKPILEKRECVNCKKIFRTAIRKFCTPKCESAYYRRLFPS